MRIVASFVFLLAAVVSRADDLGSVGARLLRQIDPALNGAGIRVAHPEIGDGGAANWQVNPTSVGQPVSLFTYWSSGGSATNFPNALGAESPHAIAVGARFYGAETGVAPGLQQVDNYEANYFFNQFIFNGLAIPAKVVNQSFISAQNIDAFYDNYAASRNVLFVSGIGNSGPPSSPATCYNGLGVAAYGGSSSVGPAGDGRSKPDITAPAALTSFSTPLVAGAAAVLAQAGARGDGGTGTSTDAVDIRTIKALLLNGAVKPQDWSHMAAAPLDTRYGAGILNVFNARHQLTGGKRAPMETTTATTGSAPVPGGNTNAVASLFGWDFRSISGSLAHDVTAHYYFNWNPSNAAHRTFTATLVWNRQANQATINDLNLYLVDMQSNVVALSTSAVDNVEHLFVPELPAGRYDLQVVKRGGSGWLTMAETYALAFEYAAVSLSISRSNDAVVLSWPVAPDGFSAQKRAGLEAPVSWSPLPAPTVVSNLNRLVLGPPAGAREFYRLRRP